MEKVLWKNKIKSILLGIFLKTRIKRISLGVTYNITNIYVVNTLFSCDRLGINIINDMLDLLVFWVLGKIPITSIGGGW